MHLWDGQRFALARWHDVVREAERVANGLNRLGVTRGQRVASVLTNSFEMTTGLLGTWLAGAVAVSLPIPARGMKLDAYMSQLARLSRHSGASVVLLESRFAAGVAGVDGTVGARLATPESIASDRRSAHAPPVGTDIAFVQYSSGSTGEPKGCVLTANAIVRQEERLGAALGIGPGDRGLMWLPMSHDMGLFGGLLLAWSHGMESAIGTPERFVRAPRTWLADCSSFGATFTVSPNFGLAMALRTAGGALPAPAPLRACVIGSDRISWQTLEAVDSALGDAGLTMRTFTPAYGLAEATLAVTSTRPEDLPKFTSVSLPGLLDGELTRADDDHPDAVRVVSAGRPLAEVEVTIDGAGPVGEVVVRSPSLASGYVGDEIRTGQRFAGGAFRTGDIGFVSDGELYPIGRLDDMVAVGGRNVYANEVEHAFGACEGVRSGSCVLLDALDAGAARLVAITESTNGCTDFDELALELRRVAASAAGIGLDECIVVSRGSLPKTPSGKVQRFRCRQLLASGELDVVARVRL